MIVKALIAVGVTVVGLVSTATAASAADTAGSTTFRAEDDGHGVRADCRFSAWKGSTGLFNHASITCDLTDTEADSSPVKVEWWQDGWAAVDLWNRDGRGSTKTVTDARTEGDPFQTLYFKACVYNNILPNSCSKTVSWKIPS